MKVLRVFACALILIPQSGLFAFAVDDAFQFFQQEARVVTASRREQSILDAPVAVEVVTHEEIEASGAANLWDLFRFRPGMNVVDGHTPHAMRAIVSIRGFVEGFARNVLVQVDGRNVVSSNAGGVFWAQLPVQLQDVERIEIIRGPNAALYGTGAGLGVINIITKKPAGEREINVQGLGGNRGLTQSAESINGSISSLDYRLSHTYHLDSGFLSAKASAANPSETNLINGGASNDFFQSNKANWRSSWNLNRETHLELFAGGSWNNEGFPMDNLSTVRDHFNEHFEMAKLSTKLGKNSSLDILSSYNEYKDTFAPTPIGSTDHIRDYQYDEEIIHRLDWGVDQRYNTTSGFSYQGTRLYSDHEFFTRSPVGYQVYRTFLSQTIRVNQYATLVGAAAWETLDSLAPHFNYQFASILRPAPNQAFRLGYSVACTIPTLRLKDLNELRDPSQQRVGNGGILPEMLIAYEAGYRTGWLQNHLETDVSLYYTLVKNIDDDVATTHLPPVEKNTGSTGVSFLNTNQAIERGAEAQFKYKFSPRRSIYVNYTYEHVTDWSQNIGEITKSVPSHAVNFGAMSDLPLGFSASFNVGYKDGYIIDNQADELAVHAYWRLDAKVTYSLPRDKDVKLFIAGQNLLKPSHQEFSDGLTVPRTYSGGVSIKFEPTERGRGA